MSNSEKDVYEMLSKPPILKGKPTSIYPDDFNNKLNKAMKYIFEQEKLDSFIDKLNSLGIVLGIIDYESSSTLFMGGTSLPEESLIHEYCEIMNKKVVGEITVNKEGNLVSYSTKLESK